MHPVIEGMVELLRAPGCKANTVAPNGHTIDLSVEWLVDKDGSAIGRQGKKFVVCEYAENWLAVTVFPTLRDLLRGDSGDSSTDIKRPALRALKRKLKLSEVECDQLRYGHILFKPTSREAAVEARKRWGARAFFYRNSRCNYEVGFCDGFRDIVLGRGRSWREALNQAPPDTLTNDQMIGLPEGDRSEFARLHALN